MRDGKTLNFMDSKGGSLSIEGQGDVVAMFGSIEFARNEEGVFLAREIGQRLVEIAAEMERDAAANSG